MNQKLYDYLTSNNLKKRDHTFCEALVYLYQNKNIFVQIQEILYEDYYLLNYESIVEEFIYLDFYEIFQSNKDKFHHNFIDHNSFTHAIDVEIFGSDTKECKLAIGYNGNGNSISTRLLDFNIHFKGFDLGSDFLDNNTDTIQEFFISSENKKIPYNKENLLEIISRYIEIIRKKYKRSEMVFYYFYNYISNNSDIPQLFYLYKKDNFIHCGEYKEDAPVDNKGFSTEMKITLERSFNFITCYNNEREILFKVDSRFIHKDNFDCIMLDPFLNAIYNINNVRSQNYQQVWKNSFTNQLKLSLKIENIDFVKIYILEQDAFSKFFNNKLYTKKPDAIISFDIIEQNIIIESENLYTQYENGLRSCYETYIAVKKINDEKKLINCNIIENNIVHQKKRM